MSTDHQRYSIANQRDAIQQYATRRGIEIVKTYADEGRSGLTLDGRNALTRLMSDVESGDVDYSLILVLDVSRWGRFQDVDESAYYEYICKRAGIQIQYCAELFDNDGSPFSAVVKSIKRAMAAEYSRELSAKVFAGQARITKLGYWTNGPAPFGYRRMVVGSDGRPRGTLKRGQHKSVSTDRTILVPGPKKEVEAVRWIFEAFVKLDLPECRIIEHLNSKKIRTSTGRQWTFGAIRRVLTNEKYIGNSVWNRTSLQLGSKRVRLAPDNWVRVDGAFKPLVERSLFDSAQTKMRKLYRRYSNSELLDLLQKLRRAQGYLSSNSIDMTPEMPCTQTYHKRFGGLRKAYELIGYDPGKNYRFIDQTQAIRDVQSRTIDDTTSEVERNGGTVDIDETSQFLTINGELDIFLNVARCRPTGEGSTKWLVRGDIRKRSDLTMVVRMDELNRDVLDYFLFPTTEISVPSLRLRESNWIALDAYRMQSLDGFYQLAARTPVTEVLP